MFESFKEDNNYFLSIAWPAEEMEEREYERATTICILHMHPSGSKRIMQETLCSILERIARIDD